MAGSPINPRLTRTVVRLADGAARMLPWRVVLALGGVIGLVWYFVVPRRRKIALENLRAVLSGTHDVRARRRIARRSFWHLGTASAELLVARKIFARPGRMRLRGPGWAQVAANSARGRGSLLVSAHLGSWEAGQWTVKLMGVPQRYVARHLDDPVLDEFVLRLRGEPQHRIHKVGGARDLLRALRDGHAILFLGDQNAGRHGVFVPFLGIPACTYPTPAVLRERLDIGLFLGVARRQPSGAYRAWLEPVPEAQATDPEAARLETLRWLNDRISAWILADPTQYNWSHRRFRTRPPGEEAGPHLPGYVKYIPPAPPPPTGEMDGSGGPGGGAEEAEDGAPGLPMST